MSIIGQAATPEPSDFFKLIFLIAVIALSIVALLLAWRIEVFRSQSIVGRLRLTDQEPIGMLLVIIGGAFTMLVFVQIICFILMGHTATNPQAATAPVTQPITVNAPATPPMTPAEMAVSASVPTLSVFVFMLLANLTIRPRGLESLGFSLSHFRAGIRYGLVGSFIAVPLTFLASSATEWLWKALQFVHPQEHELLRVMGERPGSLITFTLVAAAVLIAPLTEETFFRGHIQTFLTHAPSRWRSWFRRPPVSQGFDVIFPGAAPLPLPVAPPRQPPAPPTALARWLSVIATSLMFAYVHDRWMMPPIFVLALCLGYAYERTGNLWTNITMHALFNTTSTVIYLLVLR